MAIEHFICRSRLFAKLTGQFGRSDDQQLVWRLCGLESGLEGMILAELANIDRQCWGCKSSTPHSEVQRNKLLLQRKTRSEALLVLNRMLAPSRTHDLAGWRYC